MKTPTKYYTDPIVYEEGFFKDPDEEQEYLDQLGKRLQEVTSRKTKKRGRKVDLPRANPTRSK